MRPIPHETIRKVYEYVEQPQRLLNRKRGKGGACRRSTTLLGGSAIDQEIIAESFTDFLAAAKESGIEDELTRQVRQSMRELASPQVAPDGRVMEWDKDS